MERTKNKMFTKGETTGGWVYILKDKMPVALVHPKHVDKFIAAPDMYEALKRLVKETRPYAYQGMLDEAEQALAQAGG